MSTNVEATIISDLSDSTFFPIYFSRTLTTLGSGADGLVLAAEHKSSRRLIAVKIPRAEKFWTDATIRDEAEALSRIGKNGKHANVAHMLAYQPDFGDTFCPAIFSEVAEFGNLLDYRVAWRVQEGVGHRPYGIAEATLWKLFKDMILALDYLHNQCGFIHRDVKSENILVTLPPDYAGSLIPTVPLFKLCDFSRAVTYPSPEGEVHEWAGTIDFAPPLRERALCEPARPAGDMWALGATLQEFALGVSPLQSRRSVAAQKKKYGEWHPQLDDDTNWEQGKWKLQFQTVYRPLNMSEQTLRIWYDVVEPMATSFRPFSDALDMWYAKLWERNWDVRVTAAALMEDLVPLVDGYIGADLDKEKETMVMRRKDSVQGAQTPIAPTPSSSYKDSGIGRAMSYKQKLRRLNSAPSYEGNDYPPLSFERIYELE